MRRVALLIAIAFSHVRGVGASHQGAKASEKYYAYRVMKEPQQIFGSYLLHFQGSIVEEHDDIVGGDPVLTEKFVPVEFIRYLFDLGDVRDFIVELGFGNWSLLSGVPQIGHTLPHAGTTLRVRTENQGQYQKLVKLLSGFFNTEMERPSTQVYPYTSLAGESFIYHNSGSNQLNYNMFRKVLNFVNYQKQFTFVNLINYMSTFESDYISFTMTFHREASRFHFHFEVNMMFREFALERLFGKTAEVSLKKLEQSGFYNPEETNLKLLERVDHTAFKSLIKRAKPIYTLQGRAHAPKNILIGNLHLAYPFIALRNEMIFSIQSFDDKSPIEFQLTVIFTPSELPILKDLEFGKVLGSFEITHKSLKKFYEKVNHSPGHVVTIRGSVSVGGSLRIKIPYQQVHRNFETITSEHVINYVLPAAHIEYRRTGVPSSPAYVKNFNNIAYKAKNYDTTVVFAIISVYLVILFFMFNSITKIKDDEGPKGASAAG